MAGSDRGPSRRYGGGGFRPDADRPPSSSDRRIVAVNDGCDRVKGGGPVVEVRVVGGRRIAPASRIAVEDAATEIGAAGIGAVPKVGEGVHVEPLRAPVCQAGQLDRVVAGGARP